MYSAATLMKELEVQTNMAIKKQEFYEGAALHQLARTGQITQISYEPPFFTLNDNLIVLLKYCTRVRSPWGFTFMRDEQLLLEARSAQFTTVIGLVCGADGIASFGYDDFRTIADSSKRAFHVSCYRRRGEHYEVNGPSKSLSSKIAPSNWKRILEMRGSS